MDFYGLFALGVFGLAHAPRNLADMGIAVLVSPPPNPRDRMCRAVIEQVDQSFMKTWEGAKQYSMKTVRLVNISDFVWWSKHHAPAWTEPASALEVAIRMGGLLR